jgi:anti-sigma factor RsiW
MTQSQNNSNLDDELLSAYIDGELTDEERAAVEARLEADPAARELVTEMRSLSGALKSLPRESLNEDLRSAVLGQIGNRPVSLPRVERTATRRLMWPAIAIAAALMLMFVQGEQNREVDRVAKVDARAAERRDRAVVGDDVPAFEALEEESTTLEAAAAPAAPAPTADDRAMVAEADAPPAETAAGTVLGEAVDESAVAARRVTDAMAASEAELEGVVHLTLTDFRSGAERFNRLLVSNGVQFVDEQPEAPASVAAPATAAPTSETLGAAGEGAATMSTRSAAPAGGLGGALSEAVTEGSSVESEAAQQSEEPEMVLVEAAPEQIEQIIFGCSQDTEAIEDVTVDPTASGMNNAPTQQRLSDFQQYSRSSGKMALGAEYKVTPEQQGVIAALNSLPKQTNAPEPNLENEQQTGWAARFYAKEQPVQADKLNWQYNRYRDQYFYSQARQQQAVAKAESVDVAKKLAKDKTSAEQPLRVLFLLHPSQEPAKK